MKVLGLMSGTSADGVDAVLTDFFGNPSNPHWHLLNKSFIPYSSSLRQNVIRAGQNSKLSASEWLSLSDLVTETHALAACRCDPNSEAEIVGCHGQTIWHRPPENTNIGGSIQILNAPLLAQSLNKKVVFDFRAADLVVGGQGAPLVPKTDEALLGRISGWRALLNLGGIANLTFIPPICGINRFCNVLGWDCGPANTLIDLAVQKITKGKTFFDRDGLLASKGTPKREIFQKWLKEPFFQKLPPKSTGRDYFGIDDLERRYSELSPLSDYDFLATITAFSGSIIGDALNTFKLIYGSKPIEILISGGGAKNQTLVREIRSNCQGIIFKSIEDEGIPIEAREALAFALLAWWNILNFPGNSPSITGAKRSVVLGTCVRPV
tara:strand:+ start:589 stop:1728 length:1140 start_codon:yes stop_codon:yes gene_type:complete